MARESHRAQLEVRDVPGMFRQALLSCKSSIGLFLTLALLSSVYETAVERSNFLSGLSFSSQNSNFSFQLSFDPKHPSKTLDNNFNNNVTPEPSQSTEGDSLLSRIMARFSPSDRSSRKVGAEIQPQEFTAEEPSSGSVDIEPSSFDVESNDPSSQSLKDVAGEGEELLLQSEDSKNNMNGFGELPASARQSDQSIVIGEHDDEEAENEILTRDGEEGGEENLEGDIYDVKEDESETDLSLPRLEFQNVNNDTKRDIQEFLAEAMDLTFFTGKLLGGRGLDQGAMPHGGFTMLVILLVLAGAFTIFLAIVGFQHAAVLGSVAYSVVSSHMGKRASTRAAIRSGFKSGIGRLMWLAILHATLRGLQSLFFMKTLFGGVMEMEQVEQLVLRLSATPFAFLAPFRDVDATDVGMAVRIGLFIGFDYIFDSIAYCLYAVACWVTIIERDFWGLGALSRSWNLVKRMEVQAVVVRVLEAILCGRTSRWLLQQAVGQFPAAFLICTGQVYFLVLWLIFYLSARSICDGPSQFSYRHLEDFLDRFK